MLGVTARRTDARPPADPQEVQAAQVTGVRGEGGHDRGVAAELQSARSHCVAHVTECGRQVVVVEESVKDSAAVKGHLPGGIAGPPVE